MNCNYINVSRIFVALALAHPDRGVDAGEGAAGGGGELAGVLLFARNS